MQRRNRIDYVEKARAIADELPEETRMKFYDFMNELLNIAQYAPLVQIFTSDIEPIDAIKKLERYIEEQKTALV